MSIFYIRRPRKQTPLAKKRRRTTTLKQQIRAYLRKHPGVTNAAKVFNVSEDKIWKMIRASR